MSNSIGLKIDLREILAIGNTACKFLMSSRIACP